MSDRYGIVYMGSKEKILDLIKYMFEREHKKEYFIDLFCGGLSVSNYALNTTRFTVVANDLNKYVTSLHKELLSGGIQLKSKKNEFITRDMFIHIRDYPRAYPEWYVGYVLNVWSFGCNQKDYLYAKDLEKTKHALHNAIVLDNFKMIEENKIFNGFKPLESLIGIDYNKNPQKRVAFMEHFKKYIASKKNEPVYKDLIRLEQIEHLNQTEHLDAVIDSQKLKSRIKITNYDYMELYSRIPESTLQKSFIYCDPPYEDSKQYQVGKEFDYDAFWKWFRECPYSVYVSSYKAPPDIIPLKFEFKQQLLDNGKRGDNKQKKVVREYIYWNGKGEADPTFEDLLFKEGAL